jgi:hypothetical protein
MWPEEPGFDQWGDVVHYDVTANRVAVARVERAVLVAIYEGSPADDNRREFVRAVCDAADAWLIGVLDWVEVLSATAFAPRPVLWRGPLERRMPVSLAHRVAVNFVLPDHSATAALATPVGVSVDLWTAATDKVAARSVPPLAHLLLRDARAAHETHDRRRAVLDAASACEVALSTWLRGHLATTLRVRDAKQLMDRRERGGGVMELYDFHVAAVGPVAEVSPGRLSGQLAGVRNRVAHGGATPTDQEAAAAIDVAAALVGALAPLPARP